MSDLKNRLTSDGLSIAVLCGGESSEREVSLVSGKAVADALNAMAIESELFSLEYNRLPDDLSPAKHLVLPVIHGAYGEDGKLCAELDEKGFGYGGSDQAASEICFDKLTSKAVAERHGIPLADDIHLIPEGNKDYSHISEALGQSFILKPRRDGSSVGLYLVHTEEDYKAAKDDIKQTEYLAEAYLDGIDLTVGVLNGKAMGVVAVRPKGGLYDYEHKYSSGMSEYEFPAKIDPVVASQLQEWAKLIHDACGCRDIARVDFRMGSNGELIFLEINTIPGMTPTSLLPKSAACEGLTFNDVVCSWVAATWSRKKECAQ